MTEKEKTNIKADAAAVLMGISLITEKLALALAEESSNEQKGENQNETVKRRIIITCR